MEAFMNYLNVSQLLPRRNDKPGKLELASEQRTGLRPPKHKEGPLHAQL
jgi:hypothetical protein